MPRRARCVCGGKLSSLGDAPGRQWFRRAAQRTTTRFESLHRLAEMAPRNPVKPYALGALLLAPAGLHFWKGRPAVDLSLTYAGLSLAGVAVLLFLLVTHASRVWAARPDALVQPRMRVLGPSGPADGGTTVRGLARRATTEIEAGISGKACLVFGVRGQVGNVDVEDAEGGDFDLELADGERVAVSLAHAWLEPHGTPARELGVQLAETLLELLHARGIETRGQRVRLAETLVREGDEIDVEGTLEGGLVSVGYRGTKPTRVLAGSETAPLRVRRVSGP